MYNLSWTNSVNTTSHVVKGVNNTSNGYFGVGFLVFIFAMIIYIITKIYGNLLHGILAASFVCTIIGSLLLAAELMVWQVVVTFLVVFLISLFVAVWAWKFG